MGTEARGCIWGPNLEAKDRIFKAFKAVKMGHLQRLLQSGDGHRRQSGQPPFLQQSKPGGTTPLQLVEELAQITKSRIRCNTGDNGDKLSSDGIIAARWQCSIWGRAGRAEPLHRAGTVQELRDARRSPGRL